MSSSSPKRTEGSRAQGWQVSIDRGGTFTDVVARNPNGRIHTAKLLSGQGQEARALEQLQDRDSSPVSELRIGTTVGTNALLTRQGGPVALLVTKGFADLLLIGDQRRPKLFSLDIPPVLPLYERVVEVTERVLADGSIRQNLQPRELQDDLLQLRDAGIEALVVALAHSHLHPGHEEQVAALARACGFTDIVLSHRSSPGIGYLARAETAVAEGLLSGPLRCYRESLDETLPEDSSLSFMKSSGGLSPKESFRGIDSVLSGPAGGALACGRIAEQHGLEAVLGFDMGGTSTDVCRWAGGAELSQSLSVAGRELRVPCLDIVTVAAGGGSLLQHRDGRAQVGPESAGASPGPACYGRGGPAALSDANLVLGRLQADQVPAVFGDLGTAPLNREAAVRALSACSGGDAAAAAGGYVAIANARMASAISELSTARGHDPRRHSLVAFGGAAGQHACGVAEELGIEHILLHPHGSVLSALGIAEAPTSSIRSLAVLAPWTDDLAARWSTRLQALAEQAEAELGGGEFERTERWFLRYEGAQTSLPAVDREDFEQQHERLFGFRRPERPVEVMRVEVCLMTPAAEPPPLPPPLSPSPLPQAAVRRSIGYPRPDGTVCWEDTPVLRRKELQAGQRGAGPLMVTDPLTTVVVDPGWSLEVGVDGLLELRHDQPAERAPLAVSGKSDDSVLLELFFARFMSLATRMGEALRQVAWSVNIKERLDFSCALFDAEGNLVSNAPHIPVHLGAMGETVRALCARLGPELRPGRSWAVNNPFAGGSHLPDITVVTPFFHEGELYAWLANRGHHSDVGGISPGSMPPFSSSLDEEGVLLEDLLLVDEGRLCRPEILQALTESPWPARDPLTVVGDLEAQLAANAMGVEALVSLMEREGATPVRTWMARVQENGSAIVQNWIEGFGDSPRLFDDVMDDGTPICVEIRRSRAPGEAEWRLIVDFSGTGSAVAGNLNAPPPVTRAALLYVLRCVLGRDIPLNEGCLRPIDLRLPEGSLLNPPVGSAVVGGNVETSQRVVDVLLGALGSAAASQGTMNNLSFGDGSFGYYETICGGAGATSVAQGRSAVHTHMTNTRITDVEILETRHPVVLREFSLRSGSGGPGRHRGGEGARRTLEFLVPVEISLLCQRRTTAPFGLAGGGSGAPGYAELAPAPDAAQVRLEGSFSERVEAGGHLTVVTPGGGGYGSSDPS